MSANVPKRTLTAPGFLRLNLLRPPSNLYWRAAFYSPSGEAETMLSWMAPCSVGFSEGFLTS
jgi:hypothetical protein